MSACMQACINENAPKRNSTLHATDEEVLLQLAQIPEPNCVCAGCGRKCGSGHASGCPYTPKVKPDIQEMADWHGFCAKCNTSWTSETKPTKCPNCGYTGIVISENVFDKEEMIAFYSCIEKDLQCTLNGTACCSRYTCKGQFPNAYCH